MARGKSEAVHGELTMLALRITGLHALADRMDAAALQEVVRQVLDGFEQGIEAVQGTVTRITTDGNATYAEAAWVDVTPEDALGCAHGALKQARATLATAPEGDTRVTLTLWRTSCIYTLVRGRLAEPLFPSRILGHRDVPLEHDAVLVDVSFVPDGAWPEVAGDCTRLPPSRSAPLARRRRCR